MSGLWILILGGFLQIFIGGEITQTAMAIGGAILFSGKLHKLFEKICFQKLLNHIFQDSSYLTLK